MKVERAREVDKAAVEELRHISARTARDLALALRLASLRMETFEPGQGEEAARELAQQLSDSARRAVDLYYLESLTQAVANSEGPVRVRRKDDLELFRSDWSPAIQHLRSEVTGCYNKVGFTLLLGCELERARRRKTRLSVALFKLEPPNATVLQEVANHGRECCRLLDVLGTFGVHGVGMLLPDTGPEGTQIAAQRVLSSFMSAGELAGRPRSQRLRVGVASHPEDGSEPRDLLIWADDRAGGQSLLEATALLRPRSA